MPLSLIPDLPATLAAQAAAAASAADADASEAQAAAYAAAAATGATFYDTIAAGLAAVSSGATFGVKAGGSDGLTRPTVYRDDAGSATLLYAVVPGSEFDDALDFNTGSQPSTADYDLVFVDAANNIAGGVLIDGTLHFKAMEADTLTSSDIEGAGSYIESPTTSSGLAAALGVDQNGNVALGVDTDGKTIAAYLDADEARADVAQVDRLGVTYAAATWGRSAAWTEVRPEIIGITSYGQSNGVNGTAVGVQAYDTLVFNGGANWPASGLSDADAHASLTAITTALAKPQVEGWSEYVKELILSENGLSTSDITYQLLVSTTAQASQTITALSQGGSYYARIITDATYGASLAAAAGKTYLFGAWSWAQGEADVSGSTNSAEYKRRMRELVNDLTTDIKAATGQTQNPICITWQMVGTSERISVAQLELADEMDNVYLATPAYPFPTSDNVHCTDVGYTRLSAYYGLVHKRVLFDGKSWEPLKPIASLRQGTLVLVKFNMPGGGKLVLDTTTVSLASQHGFKLYDAAGAEIVISSVSLVGHDTVKLVGATAPGAGAKVKYAQHATAAVGNEFTYRGNLRDNVGDSRIYAAGGANYAMHNWSVIFTHEVA